jgi:hypothetical protein
VEGLAVGEQIQLDQALARGGDRERIEVQMTGNGSLGVVAQPVGVGDGDQEQVEGPDVGFSPTQVLVADQAMVDPAEARRDLAQAFGTRGVLVDHGGR